MVSCESGMDSQRVSLQLLEGDSPGKVGGAPGNAFELVYTSVTDTVRERMHAVDPVLAEYIRHAASGKPRRTS